MIESVLNKIIHEEIDKGKEIAIYPCGKNGMLAKEIVEKRYGKNAICIDNKLALYDKSIMNIDEFLDTERDGKTVIITVMNEDINHMMAETVEMAGFDVKNLLPLMHMYVPEMPEGNVAEYLSNINHISEISCYNKAMNVVDNAIMIERFEKEKIIAHAYWYGELGEKQIFSLKSFLATQDMSKVEVWLWLDEENGYHDYESNVLLQPILPFIVVKKYNPIQESMGLPFEKIREVISIKSNLPQRADAFRIMILYKYGGFYFDMDMLFLKDMSYLWLSHEFAYAWSTAPFANSAALYFRKESYLIEYIAEKALKMKCFLPWVLFDYRDEKIKNLMIYPCAFFDPLWMGEAEGMPLKIFGDLFVDKDKLSGPKLSTYRDFFRGTYAFHWHNRWKDEIHENSYFRLFEAEFDRIINFRGI